MDMKRPTDRSTDRTDGRVKEQDKNSRLAELYRWTDRADDRTDGTLGLSIRPSIVLFLSWKLDA